MLTPFEEAERRTQQFAAKLLLYSHVNKLMVRDEFLMEQFEEDRGGDRWDAMRDTLQERRQINQNLAAAADMVEDLDGVSA
jgi:hypothetical protein